MGPQIRRRKIQTLGSIESDDVIDTNEFVSHLFVCLEMIP